MTMEWGGEHTAQKNTLVTGPYILLARSFVIILGCIGVAWGIVEIPVFWQDSSIERIATQIIAGNTFKVETLAQQLPITEGIKKAALCRPAALRSAAIIELRMMEIAALANNRQNLVDQYKSLVDVIRSSLSCAPADPFLWLALYSVEMSENRFRPDLLKYLRLSYRLGPHEGWIALKRNPLAFAAFQQLSPDLREAAVNEFAAMLGDSEFLRPSRRNFDWSRLARARANFIKSDTPQRIRSPAFCGCAVHARLRKFTGCWSCTPKFASLCTANSCTAVNNFSSGKK